MAMLGKYLILFYKFDNQISKRKKEIVFLEDD